VIEFTSKITCTYQVDSTENNIEILGLESNINETNIKIFINNVEINFTKTYTFPTTGSNEVIYQIASQINLDNIFQDITTLTSIKLEPLENINGQITEITSMKNSFKNCEGLNDISISNVKITTQDLSYAFYNLPKLSTINLENFDTSIVRDMSYMFSLSTNIKSLVLNINTTEVLFMQNMFEGCTGLTSLDITSLDTSNVVMMDNMFKQTSNLKKY
jgi:bacterial surface protein 26-residue repeat